MPSSSTSFAQAYGAKSITLNEWLSARQVIEGRMTGQPTQGEPSLTNTSRLAEVIGQGDSPKTPVVRPQPLASTGDHRNHLRPRRHQGWHLRAPDNWTPPGCGPRLASLSGGSVVPAVLAPRPETTVPGRPKDRSPSATTPGIGPPSPARPEPRSSHAPNSTTHRSSGRPRHRHQHRDRTSRATRPRSRTSWDRPPMISHARVYSLGESRPRDNHLSRLEPLAAVVTMQPKLSAADQCPCSGTWIDKRAATRASSACFRTDGQIAKKLDLDEPVTPRLFD